MTFHSGLTQTHGDERVVCEIWPLALWISGVRSGSSGHEKAQEYNISNDAVV